MRKTSRDQSCAVLMVLCGVFTVSCQSDNPGVEQDTGDSAPDVAVPEPVVDSREPLARTGNLSCLAGSPAFEYTLQPVLTDAVLELPVAMAQVPGGSDNLFYILEKNGRVVAIDPEPADSTTMSDALQLPVSTKRESGGTGIAFHPDYSVNGRVFLAYGAAGDNSPFELRISEFARGADGIALADERRIITVEKNNPVHFGGAMSFGPDGYLYLSVGDDGENSLLDEQRDRAQDPSNFYGSVLRIDVDTSTTGSYAIPADNPDYGTGTPSAVWAYGFRNPWKLTFDSEAPHHMWISDVGWRKQEEINKVVRGGNYGWPECEGNCPDSRQGYIDPVHTYPNIGGAAAIAGYVYRGSDLPDLYGKLIFADYIDRGIRTLDPSASEDSDDRVASLIDAPFNIASFAEGSDREIYVLDFTEGGVYRLAAGTTVTDAELPARLSETGCFSSTTDGDPTPLAGVYPYNTAQFFWSDTATKKRLLALPDGQSIDAGNELSWELPNGGVTIKHFYLGGSIIETRFFVRYDDGSFGGYTYEWDEDRNDASLVDADGKTVQIDDVKWEYPSRGDCLRCHSDLSGFTLSLETRQLNVAPSAALSSGANDQMDSLEAAGLITAHRSVRSAPYVSRTDLLDDSLDLDTRARSYIHVNCSSCHQGEGSAGRANWDARIDRDVQAMGVCQQEPFERVNLTGATDEYLLHPGTPELSTLWLRMMDRGSNASMPPLATHLIDSTGTDLIKQWILAMDGTCSSGP